MKKNLLLDILCCLFVLLFLYTGVMKFLEHQVFLTALQKSPLLKPYALILSIAVPLAELIIAASMLVPRFRRKALYGFLVLMAVFTIYIGFMLYFRSDRPCTCGGIIKYMNWHQHFYFNSVLTALSALSLWLNKKVMADATSEKIQRLSYPT